MSKKLIGMRWNRQFSVRLTFVVIPSFYAEWLVFCNHFSVLLKMVVCVLIVAGTTAIKYCSSLWLLLSPFRRSFSADIRI